MSPARLDIMLDEDIKKQLQHLASLENCSVSELVRRLIVDHIAADTRIPTEADPFDAVADVLLIQDLREQFERAYAQGMVYPFSRYCELYRQGKLPEHARDIAFIYDDLHPNSQDENYYPIVADKCVDEYHDDIVSTWNDILGSADVFIGDDSELEDLDCDPYYLEVWRKWPSQPNSPELMIYPSSDWPGEAVK